MEIKEVDPLQLVQKENHPYLRRLKRLGEKESEKVDYKYAEEITYL